MVGFSGFLDGTRNLVPLFIKGNMKKYKHYCPNCKEAFYSDRLNMNEKHHCGHFGIMDWAYEGEDEPPKD